MGVRCEVLNGTVLRGFEQEERTFSLASDSKEGWTTLVRVPLSFFFLPFWHKHTILIVKLVWPK